jgi:hypothetical protein
LEVGQIEDNAQIGGSLSEGEKPKRNDSCTCIDSFETMSRLPGKDEVFMPKDVSGFVSKIIEAKFSFVYITMDPFHKPLMILNRRKHANGFGRTK